MKFWVRFENRFDVRRVAGGSAMEDKDKALLAAKNHNELFSPKFGEFRATEIQLVDINTDKVMYMLLTSFGVQSWQEWVYTLIDKGDPAVTFGEIVKL